MYASAPKCGRRSRGRWGSCPTSRPRTRWGRYLPACAQHLTLEERAAFGMLPGSVSRPCAEIVDVAKIRAGDRD